MMGSGQTGKEGRICRRGLVSGLVQGVGFRAHVQSAALAAGLEGYARNLPDGRVEVVLCGEAPVVARVQQKVAEGPRAARVADIRWEELDSDWEGKGFSRG